VAGGELAAIFLGGALGALARAGLAQALAVRADQWPWATFAVNIVAALALGYLVTRLQEGRPSLLYRHVFLTSGFCGALSTFSTMMVELLRMLDGGHWALALAYTLASLIGGLVAVFAIGRLVRRSSR
jgi:fluoride exporter